MALSARCIFCCYRISTDKDVLQCQGCFQWQHRICNTDVQPNFYSKFYRAVLMKTEYPVWFCEHCTTWKTSSSLDSKHRNSNKQPYINYDSKGGEDVTTIPNGPPSSNNTSDDEFMFTRDHRGGQRAETEISAMPKPTGGEHAYEVLIPPSQPMRDDAKDHVTYQLIQTTDGEKLVTDNRRNIYTYCKKEANNISVYMDQTLCLQTTIRVSESSKQFISVIRQIIPQQSHENNNNLAEDVLSDITEIYVDVDTISNTDDDDLDEEIPELTEHHSSTGARQSSTPDMPELITEAVTVAPTPFSTPSRNRLISRYEMETNKKTFSNKDGSEEDGRKSHTYDTTVPYFDSSSDSEKDNTSAQLTYTVDKTFTQGRELTSCMSDNHGYTYNLVSRVGRHFTWYCMRRLTHQCFASVVQVCGSRSLSNVIPHNHTTFPDNPPPTPSPTPIKSHKNPVTSPKAESTTTITSTSPLNKHFSDHDVIHSKKKHLSDKDVDQLQDKVPSKSETNIEYTSIVDRPTGSDIIPSSETATIPEAEYGADTCLNETREVHQVNNIGQDLHRKPTPESQYDVNEPCISNKDNTIIQEQYQTPISGDNGSLWEVCKPNPSLCDNIDNVTVEERVNETDRNVPSKFTRRLRLKRQASPTSSSPSSLPDDTIDIAKILPVNIVNSNSELLLHEQSEEIIDGAPLKAFHSKDWRPVTNRNEPIRYHEIHSCKKVPKSVLVDSDGYSYTTKIEQTTSAGTKTHWKCNMFGFGGRCKAFVTFNPTTQAFQEQEWCVQRDLCESVIKHNHDPNRLTALMAVLKMMLKKTIYRNESCKGDISSIMTAVTNNLPETDQDLINANQGNIKSLKNFIKLQQKIHKSDKSE